MPSDIKADFNGDGWCDYALGVPYPLNSKMKGYNLNQLMMLGQASSWEPVFNGKKGWELADMGYEDQTWPRFQVDLTDIRLVFPSRQGAPFVLGLYAGLSDDAPVNAPEFTKPIGATTILTPGAVHRCAPRLWQVEDVGFKSAPKVRFQES